MTAFQAALTFGAPFGVAALEGRNPGQVPEPLQLVTGFSAFVWLFATLLVLARGGRALAPSRRVSSVREPGVLVGLLGQGALMNLASSRPWERFGWGPFTLVMFTLSALSRHEMHARPDHTSPHAGRIDHQANRRVDTVRVTLPVWFQRIESAAVAVLVVVAFVQFGFAWWWLIAIFLLWDLSMLGYLASPTVGAVSYNVGHSYLGPATLLVLNWVAAGDARWPVFVGLTWAFHIAVDRLLGYGLKFTDRFTHTHLGEVGKKR